MGLGRGMGMRVMEKIKIVVVLFLGLTALGLLTWSIGKVYLELVSKSSQVNTGGSQTNQQDSTSQTTTVLVLPDVTFWTCQVGVFKTELNALNYVEQLQAVDLNAGVITSDPWIVGVGLGHAQDELSEMRQTLASKGISSLPKQIVLAERSFRVTGNGGQLTTEMLKNTYTILQKGLADETLAEEKNLWNSLAGSNPPQKLQALHSLYDQVRGKLASEERNALVLSLFFESQRVINLLSSK